MNDLSPHTTYTEAEEDLINCEELRMRADNVIKD